MTADSFKPVLLWGDLVIQNGCCEDVRQTVVGLLFGAYAGRLVTLVSPTYDVIGDIEDLEIDLFNLVCLELVALFQCEHAFDSRLRMNLGVVLLQDGALDALQVFAGPIDLKEACDCVHEPLSPSITSNGPVMPRRARNTMAVAQAAI